MAITANEARELWDYDPEIGIFFFRKGKRAECMAGSFDGKYRRLQFKGKYYKASRVAWLYMTGSWPTDQIDHINGVKTDDRFSNLREATNAQNCRNRKVKVTNKLGIKGIHRSKYGFTAQVVVDGKHMFSKQFKTIEAAKLAYGDAVTKLHGEYARL